MYSLKRLHYEQYEYMDIDVSNYQYHLLLNYDVPLNHIFIF